MSEFFEPPVPPPEPPPHERRQPEFGPPDNYLGALIALDLVLARTSELAVVVPAATIYPRGATFNVVVLMRRELRDPFDWHPFHTRRRREGGLPGPFAFVCEWPARGIGLTRVEIDSQALLDAANRTKPLWPDDDEGPSPGRGWIGQTRIG